MFYKQHLEAFVLAEEKCHGSLFAFILLSIYSILFATLIKIFLSSIFNICSRGWIWWRQAGPKTQKHLEALTGVGTDWGEHLIQPLLLLLGHNSAAPTGLVPVEEVAQDIYLYSMGFAALIQEPQFSPRKQQAVYITQGITHTEFVRGLAPDFEFSIIFISTQIN